MVDLGLTPDVFASFLDIQIGSGFRGMPVTIVECNREQLALVESGLRGGLGVAAYPVLLEKLADCLGYVPET